MITRIILTVIILSSFTTVYSQTNSDNSYLTLSYSFGITSKLSPEDPIYGNESGTINTVELSNVPEDNIGFFANFTSTTYKLNENYSDANGGNHVLKNYGASGGARIYSNNKKIFFDAGAGFYNIESFRGGYSTGWITAEYRRNSISPGVNIGLGARVKLSNAYTLVLKGKINNLFFDRSSSGFYQEIIFNAGIEVDNVKQVYTSNISYSGNLSSGIILGNTGLYNDKFVGSYGAELTYGISNNISLVADYLHKSSDKYYGYYTTFETWENNYGGGVRNYFGNSNLKPFLECLVDLNIRKENSGYMPQDNSGYTTEDNILIKNSLGLSLGTGAEFDLSDRVTGILKGNFTFFDNADNVAGMYGGLKYRF